MDVLQKNVHNFNKKKNIILTEFNSSKFVCEISLSEKITLHVYISL